MSYDIVYDRVVIESSCGFTFIVLVGSNNCYVSNKKRSRDWSVLHFAKSEDEIYDGFFKNCGSDYQEHFMWNGKFLDDVELMNWVKNGIKNALTVEEVVKRLGHPIYCNVLTSGNTFEGRKTTQVQFIRTNEEFENYIIDAHTTIAEAGQRGLTAYPIINVSSDNEAVHIGGHKKESKGKVLVKIKGKYLAEWKKNDYSSGFSWTLIVSDKKEAYVFDLDIPVDRIVVENIVGKHQVVRYKEDEKEEPKFLIEIRQRNSNLLLGYYNRASSKRLFYTPSYNKTDKRCEKTMASAKRIVQRLENQGCGPYIYNIVPSNI